MDLFTKEEVMAGRLAYEQDRRDHKHWQPHWEEISHTDHVHWIIMSRGKKPEAPPPAPKGLVVVVSA